MVFLRTKEAAEDYFLNCRIRGLAKETMSNKYFVLKSFLDYLGSIGIKDIEQIKRRDIQKYIENQLNKGLKARTINNRLKNIKVFFDYCEDEEFIKSNPFTRIKMLKEVTPQFQVFNDDEIQKMLGFYSSKSFKDIKYKTMLYVLTDTGIRASELRNLRLEDINDNSIFIQKAKGGKQRTVPISMTLKKQLNRYERARIKELRYKNADTQYYFFNKFFDMYRENGSIQKMLKDAFIATSNRKGVRASPHTLRHYYALKSMELGTSIYQLSKNLGHETVAITEIYLRHITNEQLEKQALQQSKSPLSML